MSWMGKGCEILCSLFSSWDAGPCGPTAKPTIAYGLAGRSWEGFYGLAKGQLIQKADLIGMPQILQNEFDFRPLIFWENLRRENLLSVLSDDQ